MAKGKQGVRRPSSGAALVEAAIALPVLLVLLFGVIDFGVLLSDAHAVGSGVRDSARLISVGQTGGDSSCAPAIPTASTQTKELVCDVERRISRSGADVRVAIRLEDVDDPADGTGDYSIGSTIKLCVEYDFRSVSGVTSPLIERTGRMHSSSVQIQLERLLEVGLIEDATEAGFSSACTAEATAS